MSESMSNLFAVLSWVASKYLGGRLVLTSGARSCSQQRAVSTSRNSYHVGGNAFDAVIQPYDEESQRILGLVAEYFGYRWGGNFKTGEYANDVVHFDDGRRVSVGRC